MAKEQKRQIEVYVQILCVVIFGVLYSLGGCGYGLYLRRVVASSFLAICMFYFSKWDKKTLYIGPAMALALSLPYGPPDSGIWLKIIARTAFGALSASVLSLYLWVKGKRLLAQFHAFSVISAFIVLGVWNPLDARAEEAVLGMLIVLLPILSLSHIKEES